MTALLQLAQYHMNYAGDHPHDGWHVVMMVMIVLVVAALVALVVLVARGFGGSHRSAAAAPADSAIAILDRRLAAGEITPEDYQQRAAILGGR